ncbi:hypothetical protein [Pelomicrobium methylotrophicum]|uniref:Uncharacterized protein n=1 Tax=Pelomicrobium methylotrophicum TaxID=2602750 RepID=A0A5C7ESN3_9PROT|nr:hypothetical protein [Pelomicrobium methylotrophicum]TXF11214.1 hypothetical protein FR698_11935 [Pelomicrobium methylotrophicum]
MNQEELDLLDREERVFACFQTVIDLLNPAETTDVNRVGNLLDFLIEEYQAIREEMHRRIGGLDSGG